MKSPFNQLTIDLMRESGYFVERVEHWNSRSNTRHDLLTVIDYLAFAQNTCVGVQSTSIGCRNDHRKKMLSAPGSLIWLLSGQSHLLLLVSWESISIGKRKSWCPTIDIFTEYDFGEEVARRLPATFNADLDSHRVVNEAARVEGAGGLGDAKADQKNVCDDAKGRRNFRLVRREE